MPYEIWNSLKARQKLREFETNNQEIVKQITEQLQQLAISREDFITGSPPRPEVFKVGNLIIIYRVWHKLKSIDVIDIVELP